MIDGIFQYLGVLGLFALLCGIADPRAALRFGCWWLAYRDARQEFLNALRRSYRQRVAMETEVAE